METKILKIRWSGQIALIFLAAAPAAAQVVLPDKSGDFKYGIYHAGFTVEKIDIMIDFLKACSSLRVVSRVTLPNGGERVFLEDARGQRLELLSDPAVKRPSGAEPLHPRDAVAGHAHLAIEVDDAVAARERILAEGYEIVFQVPRDFSEGYIVSEVDVHRVLFIEGPSGVSIEFFEIKKQP